MRYEQEICNRMKPKGDQANIQRDIKNHLKLCK